MARRPLRHSIWAFAGVAVIAVAGLSSSVSAGAQSSVPQLDGAGTLQSWGARQLVANDIHLEQDPTVVITSSGRSVAMWIQRRFSVSRLMVATSAPGTDVWSTPVLLSRGAFYATIATHGKDQATVAWQQDDAKGPSVKSRTMHADGTWGQTRDIAHWTQTGGVTVSLVLAGNADGDLVAAWTRGKYIRASYRVSGSSWQPETVIPVSRAYALDGVANVDDSGEADLVFPAPTTQGRSDLYVYHRDSSGRWSGQSVARFSTAIHFSSRMFSAAANAHGDLGVTWVTRKTRSNPWTVNFRYRPRGTEFSAPERVASHAFGPDLAVDGAGITTLAWVQNDHGSTSVDVARRSALGQWTPPQTIAQEISTSSDWQLQEIVGNPAGDALLSMSGEVTTASGGLRRRVVSVRCPVGVACGEQHHFLRPLTVGFLDLALAPSGDATAVWPVGCFSEACLGTGIYARDMTPVGASG